MPPSTALRTTAPIEHWSLVNAGGLLLATAAATWTQSLWPIVGTGVALLAALVGVAWGRWTSTGAFGWANAVTGLRVGLLALLPTVAGDGGAVVLLGVAFLGGDGLDGWVARRRGTTSSFGAFFDKESDALFLLTLCAGAAFTGRLPLSILWIGLLRYGFVVLLFLLRSRNRVESRFSLARYAYAAAVGALLGTFVLPPSVYEPAVTLAAGALVLSFAWSTIQLVVYAR